MPVFGSEEQAVKTHESYCYDTDHEEKFTVRHVGYSRAKQLVDWIPKGSIVLGVGCNSGGLERTIIRVKKGTVCYGVDVNPNMVAQARAKGVMAKVAKAEDLPFSNGYFDVVIFSEILEHLYNPKVALLEGRRVLKSDGLIIGSVPHPKSINSTKRPIEEHHYHMRIYNKTALKRELYMFEDIEVTPITYLYGVNKNPQWWCFKGTK